MIAALPGRAQVHLPPPPPVVHLPNLIWNHFMLNQIRTTALGSSMFLDVMIKDMQGLAATVGHVGGANAAWREGQTLAQANAMSTPAAARPGALAFEPSGRSLLAERIAASDPSQDPAQLDSLFSNLYRAYLDAFREEHERLGMPLHDVAAAFTAYVVTSYLYAHDLPAIDAETSLAVYRQSANRFVANETLAAMTGPERELLAETFVVMGATPRLIFEETGDPARRQQAGLDNLTRVFGADAAALRLSPDGIGR
jgi:hypothetical protein